MTDLAGRAAVLEARVPALKAGPKPQR